MVNPGALASGGDNLLFFDLESVHRWMYFSDHSKYFCNKRFVSIRGAPDKLSGRIIRLNSWFSDYLVSGRIFLAIRRDSRILKVAFFDYLFC